MCVWAHRLNRVSVDVIISEYKDFETELFYCVFLFKAELEEYILCKDISATSVHRNLRVVDI